MLKELSNIYLEEGLKALQQNRLTTAQVKFQNVICINNDNWEAMNLLGLCLYTFGDFQRAEGLWRKSIYLNSKEENRSYQYLEELKEIEFLSLCDLYNKVLQYAKQGDFKKSEKLLKGDNFVAYKIIPFINLKGLCLFKLGKSGEAVSLWKQSLFMDMENEQALNYIINHSDEKGEKTSFSLLLRKILKIS